MNFVLVNDGWPSHDSACRTCARPLSSGYIRHVPTGERYCDHDCYRKHQLAAALVSWSFAQPSCVAASHRMAIEAIAMSNAIAYWSYTTHVWALSRSLTQAFLSAHKLITLEGGDS